MRIVVAPGAFKGTMTAAQAAARIAGDLEQEFPGAEITSLPMADGGDGTVDVLTAHGYAPRSLAACDALGLPRETVAAQRDGTVVIELARTCGMLTIGAPAPRTASTAGLGLAMRAAIDAGARELVIALGGSASTDGGLGILRGLAGERCGGLAELEVVASAEPPAVPVVPALPVPVVVLVDVASPLTGPEGAAFAFGPQKGLDAAGCARADAVLARWAGLLGIDPALPGSGAAGGAAAALAALGAALVPGGPELAQRIGLPAAIAGADLVVTGEGCLDATTLAGKAPAAVARLAAEAGVPCRIVAGVVDHTVAARLGATAVLLG